MAAKNVEVLIIGGGITGVGIAQMARAQGYNVQLLEQGDIGKQTSANSSKLIHGGLRYLETGQFHLVYKALKERAALLHLAPDLVKPVPFYIPVYKTSQRPAWLVRLGLSLYALLSLFNKLGRFRTLPRSQWSQLAGLTTTDLVAVFQYWDAQTDDTLLTQAVARSATFLGADIQHHAQCQTITQNFHGYHVEYQQQGETHHTQAKVVINAAGPWVNHVLGHVIPSALSEDIDWVQGAHLLLDIPEPNGILYLESHLDERVIFVMPWYGKTLIGTTETTLTTLTERPTITDSEQTYLLAIYHHYFPEAGSTKQLTTQIVETFCGVRVLPKQQGQAFSRARDTLMHSPRNHPKLMNIYGGKLTTFRTTASHTLEFLTRHLGPRQAIADINKLPLQ